MLRHFGCLYRIPPGEKKFRPNTALLLSVLILLNPAVIFNSSIWGQVDIIVTLMMILVIYLLVKNKPIWASAAFMAAFLAEATGNHDFPVLAFVLIRNIIVSENRKKDVLNLLISIGVMAGLFFLIPLPFAGSQEPLWLVKQFISTVGQYDQASLNAFNLFALLGQNFISSSQAVFLRLTTDIWGFILIALVCLLFVPLYKKSQRIPVCPCSAYHYGVFALGHSMHDRYLFPVPILLLFAFILQKDKRLVWPVILTFVALLLNQSLSLYYYRVMIPLAWTIGVSAVGMAVLSIRDM